MDHNEHNNDGPKPSDGNNFGLYIIIFLFVATFVGTILNEIIR